MKKLISLLLVGVMFIGCYGPTGGKGEGPAYPPTTIQQQGISATSHGEAFGYGLMGGGLSLITVGLLSSAIANARTEEGIDWEPTLIAMSLSAVVFFTGAIITYLSKSSNR